MDLGRDPPAGAAAELDLHFQVCLKTKLPPGSVTQNYTMFLFCGMLPWLLFQDTVLRSAPSMVEQATLITRTLFPAEVVRCRFFCRP